MKMGDRFESNKRAASRADLPSCEICGKGIKSRKNTTEIAGSDVGPDCAKILKKHGFTW